MKLFPNLNRTFLKFFLAICFYIAGLIQGSADSLKLDNNCGPICIYQTAIYFDKQVTWESVVSPYSQKLKTQGLSLLDIKNSLGELGLSAQHRKLSAKEFAESKFKYAIFHLNNDHGGHFKIVRNLTPNGILIIDYPNLEQVRYSDVNAGNSFDVLIVGEDDRHDLFNLFKWIVFGIVSFSLIKLYKQYKNGAYPFQK